MITDFSPEILKKSTLQVDFSIEQRSTRQTDPPPLELYYIVSGSQYIKKENCN